MHPIIITTLESYYTLFKLLLRRNEYNIRSGIQSLGSDVESLGRDVESLRREINDMSHEEHSHSGQFSSLREWTRYTSIYFLKKRIRDGLKKHCTTV